MINGMRDWCGRFGPSRTVLILAGILVLAAGMRFYHLAWPGLWTDEFIVAHEMSEAPSANPKYDLQKTYIDYVFRQPLTRKYKTDFAFRLPSPIVGVASLVLVFLVCSHIDPRMALAGSLLVAVAPTHLRYSQEGRYYIWIFFNTLLLVHALYVLKAKPRWWGAIYVALGMFLLSMTQRTCVMVPFVVVPAFCACYANTLSRRFWIITGVGFIAGALAATPAYINALAMAHDIEAGTYRYRGTLGVIHSITPGLYLNTVAEAFYAEFGFLASTPQGATDWAVLGVFVAGCLLLARSQPRTLVFLLVCFIVPATVIFYLSLEVMLVHIRYLFFCVPFIMLVLIEGVGAIALAAAAVFQRVNQRCAAAAAMAVVIGFVLLAIPSLQQYYSEMKYSTKWNVEALELLYHETDDLALLIPKGQSFVDYHVSWYLKNRPELRDAIRQVDAKTTESALREMRRALGSGRMIVVCSDKRMSTYDTNLFTAAQTLVTSGTAVEVKHHDGNAIVFSTRAMNTTDTKVAAQRRLAWLNMLSAKWRGPDATLAEIQWRRIQRMEDLGLTKHPEYENAKAFVRNHPTNYNQLADLLLREGDLDGARNALRRAVKERPWYPLSYVQEAELYDASYTRSKNPDDLRSALDSIDKARTMYKPPPEWLTGKRSSLEQKLRDAQRGSPSTVER